MTETDLKLIAEHVAFPTLPGDSRRAQQLHADAVVLLAEVERLKRFEAAATNPSFLERLDKATDLSDDDRFIQLSRAFMKSVWEACKK